MLIFIAHSKRFGFKQEVTPNAHSQPQPKAFLTQLSKLK